MQIEGIRKYFIVCICAYLKKILHCTLSSTINSFFQTLFIAEIHIGSCVLMYNPFVSTAVYNTTCGHIVKYVFFLSSHLGDFCKL